MSPHAPPTLLTGARVVGPAGARRAELRLEGGRVAGDAAHPAMVAVVATFFPLNTHLAFYSSFWGAASLMLVALFAGSLLGREREVS